MPEDWRLTNLETQSNLRGESFARKPYRPYRGDGSTTIAPPAGPKLTSPGDGDGACHEGYATAADYLHGPEYEWVCVPCSHAFAVVMGWRDVTSKVDP